MNLKLALFDDASGSGNSTHRFVATGHGILSLSVNMSPMSRATSHGAQRLGRFRTENRSEEHTSELQSLMRISYAVFCLKKKKTQINSSSFTPSSHLSFSITFHSTTPQCCLS